jgi:hypothetical protein
MNKNIIITLIWPWATIKVPIPCTVLEPLGPQPNNKLFGVNKSATGEWDDAEIAVSVQSGIMFGY